MRAFLRKQLADQYEVVVAEDGQSGWRQVQKVKPDVVVSDGHGHTGGRSLCERMKMANEISIPVILMGENGGASPDADAVLPKPFSLDTLEQRVDQHLPTRALPDPAGEEGGSFLKEVVREVERRLNDPDFSVQRLAEIMSMSRRHLTRRVKATADRTPALLIRERRIERAKEHLASDPETIAGVARTVGFRSPSHFSQVFRRQVGCPPSTYMQRTAE